MPRKKNVGLFIYNEGPSRNLKPTKEDRPIGQKGILRSVRVQQTVYEKVNDLRKSKGLTWTQLFLWILANL